MTRYDYDRYGHRYSGIRQTDPHIAAQIHAALGDARTVVNVGAGSGSYEPADRYVIAVEPSAVMRAQRKTPAIAGTADALPFDDGAFDAAMAVYTVHHWPDMGKGLRELRRVTRGQVVIMTSDPEALDQYWNIRYFPEVVAAEKRRYPPLDFLRTALGGRVEIRDIQIPLDCIDGFQEAFYGRPEAFLQEEVRKAQSAWGFVPAEQHPIIVQRLADDLASGEWDRQYGHYRTQPTWVGSIRLVIGH
ncbi:class I SAM-dependent methyltransferase [Dinghuibacter silviterrae]|uniref:Methyltransferase family protein n=1 Tax=Dinghuibacter silviterrae TaxID=1539049 RepID=A0A4V3GLR9_9BACT|nr:class I SAM-dependent methyltransferase [Dinghuibacter silviterrae]TDX00583.1 methyltransferase family protein [Dinghuibacter silviterrae]